jgi:Mitochondrial carrier protein
MLSGATQNSKTTLELEKSKQFEPITFQVRDFASGALIGAAISTLFYPINVVKTHIQTKLGGPFQPLTQVWREVSRERGGWRKMFLGVHVNYTRALISWGVINASYGLLKKFFIDS